MVEECSAQKRIAPEGNAEVRCVHTTQRDVFSCTLLTGLGACRGHIPINSNPEDPPPHRPPFAPALYVLLHRRLSTALNVLGADRHAREQND